MKFYYYKYEPNGREYVFKTRSFIRFNKYVGKTITLYCDNTMPENVRNIFIIECCFMGIFCFIKADNKKVQEYHCNSFMVNYKKNEDYDLHYRNLTQRYEISKIVREDKLTKRVQVIYQSRGTEERELAGIEKMLVSADIQVNEKMTKAVLRLNQRFGKYHTLEMLSNMEQFMEECCDKRDKALVKDFIELWRKRTNGI